MIAISLQHKKNNVKSLGRQNNVALLILYKIETSLEISEQKMEFSMTVNIPIIAVLPA
jgi:hypothetical protein